MAAEIGRRIRQIREVEPSKNSPNRLYYGKSHSNPLKQAARMQDQNCFRNHDLRVCINQRGIGWSNGLCVELSAISERKLPAEFC